MDRDPWQSAFSPEAGSEKPSPGNELFRPTEVDVVRGDTHARVDALMAGV